MSETALKREISNMEQLEEEFRRISTAEAVPKVGEK